jgi:hypothetical protein
MSMMDMSHDIVLDMPLSANSWNVGSVHRMCDSKVNMRDFFFAAEGDD